MASIQSGSTRWTHFHSALQLAIQRSAHKWTYEDFTECFSLWCEEEPEASAAMFKTVGQYMESGITNRCEQLFTQFNVKDNLDKLHAVVTEARARKQTNYEGKDIWRPDLEPKAAVRARTIPVLEKERDRLKQQLAELDTKNLELQARIQDNVKSQANADEETTKILDALEEALAKWSELPMDEMQSWTLQTAESISSTTPR
ncbi:hypothetical protein C8Q75DRAFT_499475 [Abortiporus biennis]|nr:hypothetical protein C8Q75DRAFT_499475 [Abortiporus biennis]